MPTKAWIEKELAELDGIETEFDFSGRHLDAGDIVSLASAIGSKALVKLDISNNDLNAEGGTALAAILDGNQIITELNIANNRFCYKAGLSAGRMSYSNNDMSGIIAIANSIKTMGAGALSKLDASNNGMFGKNDETGTTAWAAALKTCTSITALNLAKNGINGNDTTILAAAISDMEGLLVLDMSSNNLTQGVENFYPEGDSAGFDTDMTGACCCSCVLPLI
jgi:Ran GTPase-activating protein (RanGAP) involved in mRNA processing and transport